MRFGPPTLALGALVTRAAAFSFNISKPVQCNNFTVEWDGGAPPYNIVIIPIMEMTGGRIMNISLPVSGPPPYSHAFTMQQPAGLDFIAVLSDASGWGSGGISELQTVQTSPEQECLKSPVHADFWFWTEPKDNPAMCSEMRISWEERAVYPVGLYGVIPGGSAWEIPVEPEKNVLSHNWTVDIADGTRFILLMGDAGQYGTGGSTNPLTVQYSSDRSCLNDASPKSTSAAPAPTASHKPSARPPAGAIAGGVIGGVAGLAIVLVALFCFRRRRDRAAKEEVSARQLLGLRNNRFSGHSANSAADRPRSWEIDTASPDAHSEPVFDDRPVDPYPYIPPATRHSMLSISTDASSPEGAAAGASAGGAVSAAVSAGAPRKPVPIGLALSSNRSSTLSSIPPVPLSARATTTNNSVMELNAVETATPGQVLVDRDDLIAMLDPPPTYKPYELRTRNPDE